MATMAILARAETGCRLTRDPDDPVRRRGKPRGAKHRRARRMGRSFFPPFLLKEMGALPRRGASWIYAEINNWVPRLRVPKRATTRVAPTNTEKMNTSSTCPSPPWEEKESPWEIIPMCRAGARRSRWRSAVWL